MSTEARRASSSGTLACDVISRAPTPGSGRSACPRMRRTHPFLHRQKSGGVHEPSIHHRLPPRRGAAGRPHGRDAHIRWETFGVDRLGGDDIASSIVQTTLLDEYAPDRIA